MNPSIKKLIAKRLTGKEFVTLKNMHHGLTVYNGYAIGGRDLRKVLSEMERDGVMLISSTKRNGGHKIASNQKEYDTYLEQCEKYLKSWAKKVRTIKKNIVRNNARLFPYKKS